MKNKYMGHALPGLRAVLDGNGETLAVKLAFNHLGDFVCRLEHIRDFVARQILEARHDSAGNNQHILVRIAYGP